MIPEFRSRRFRGCDGTIQHWVGIIVSSVQVKRVQLLQPRHFILARCAPRPALYRSISNSWFLYQIVLYRTYSINVAGEMHHALCFVLAPPPLSNWTPSLFVYLLWAVGLLRLFALGPREFFCGHEKRWNMFDTGCSDAHRRFKFASAHACLILIKYTSQDKSVQLAQVLTWVRSDSSLSFDVSPEQAKAYL